MPCVPPWRWGCGGRCGDLFGNMYGEEGTGNREQRDTQRRAGIASAPPGLAPLAHPPPIPGEGCLSSRAKRGISCAELAMALSLDRATDPSLRSARMTEGPKYQ